MALHLPDSLFAYPWETLKNPTDKTGAFLSLVGSVIRCYDPVKPENDAWDPMSKETLNFFLVSSSPDNRWIGDLELRSYKQIRFKKIKPAIFENFSDTIEVDNKCDGFIFWGHGEIDREDGSGTLLFLQKSPQRKFLKGSYDSFPVKHYNVSLACVKNKMLRVAYIFACESAFWDTKALEFRSSIVGSLLDRTALTFVVGAQTPIDVEAARACLEGCLAALIAKPRLPFDLAISKGRMKIRELPTLVGDKTKYGALDWWVPVVYAKPGFLGKLANVALPSDPTDVPVPSLPPSASATPVGGLDAAQNITGPSAVKNVFLNDMSNLLS